MDLFEKEVRTMAYNPADKPDRVQDAKKTLTEALKNLATSDVWQQTLDRMALWGRYSPARFSFRNQLLVAYQRGSTSAVATFKGWEQLGRYVKKGEKAVWILQPRTFKKDVAKEDGTKETVSGLYFKPMPVFAVEQTEGAALPEGIVGNIAPRFEGEAPLEDLLRYARTVVLKVEVRDRQLTDASQTANGWFNRAAKAIVVISEGRSKAEQFKTLAHELAHAKLHTEATSRTTEEVEAESVAYVISKACGVNCDDYSCSYVSIWSGMSPDSALKLIEECGTRIAKCAAEVLDAVAPVAHVDLVAEAA
jgi:antirestriction protein ArdC